MNQSLRTLSGALALAAGPTWALAQDLPKTGSRLTGQSGTTLYRGLGGLSNQAGGTLTTAGTLRVAGPLTTPGLLNLSTGPLEVRGGLTTTGPLAPRSPPIARPPCAPAA